MTSKKESNVTVYSKKQIDKERKYYIKNKEKLIDEFIKTNMKYELENFKKMIEKNINA